MLPRAIGPKALPKPSSWDFQDFTAGQKCSSALGLFFSPVAGERSSSHGTEVAHLGPDHPCRRQQGSKGLRSLVTVANREF